MHHSHLDILVPALDHQLVHAIGTHAGLGQAVPRADLLADLLVRPPLVRHLRVSGGGGGGGTSA